MRGMNVILNMTENSESVLARHAERGEAGRDRPAKIMWRRVGALDAVERLNDPAKALREAVARDRPAFLEAGWKDIVADRVLSRRANDRKRHRRQRMHVWSAELGR